MDKRVVYSQNFLINKKLVAELIAKSSITENDIVYEVGAGEGLITEELLKKARKVIAFELDNNLFTKLVRKFQNEKNLELKFGNFLVFDLPDFPYKIFSNPPFNITSEIIKKLTLSKNPPEDTYLILQKEAAEKFTGRPYAHQNSLMTILLKPWFNFEIIHEFKHGDFSPRPRVDTVLLRIKKRSEPVINLEEKRFYEDFVTYIFNASKPFIVKNLKPSDLDFEKWINIFRNNQDCQKLVKGSFLKMLRQQEKLEKIHRTRVDKNWRRFQKSHKKIDPIGRFAPSRMTA